MPHRDNDNSHVHLDLLTDFLPWLHDTEFLAKVLKDTIRYVIYDITVGKRPIKHEHLSRSTELGKQLHHEFEKGLTRH